MNIIKEIWQAIIDFLESIFGGKGGGDMGRFRPESECADFTKKTINFCGHMITINATYEPEFIQLANWININPLIRQNITRVDSFACRVIGATGSWSYHSFGQAIDINPDDFPMVDIGQKYALPSWMDNLCDIARSLGFRSGRDWNSIYDPMHIEIGSRLR